MFSDSELKYLKTQRLARIATVSKNYDPDVVPVAFEFARNVFWIGSHSQDIFFKTQKYHNIKNGNNKITLVIDDLESVQPWKPRGIKIKGTGEIKDHKGIFGEGKYIEFVPKTKKSWGLT